VIIHWDSDDWSHPERIAEQVAFLQASGKEAVGYREMLFWRETKQVLGAGVEYSQTAPPRSLGSLALKDGEAWLYSNGNPGYCLGTSLCYWRRVWEKRPFEDLAHGEDYAWLKGVDSLGISSRSKRSRIMCDSFGGDGPDGSIVVKDGQPRMIASIHGGNTSPAYQHLEACEKQGEKWKRVPQWDDFCRKVMTL